jgi:hypothetical protein
MGKPFSSALDVGSDRQHTVLEGIQQTLEVVPVQAKDTRKGVKPAMLFKLALQSDILTTRLRSSFINVWPNANGHGKFRDRILPRQRSC